MSETEFWQGKIREIPIDTTTLENSLIRLLIAHGVVVDEDKDDILDLFYSSDEVADKYMVLNGKLYERRTTEFDPYDIFEMKHGEDGWIEFQTSFYNGGGTLSEVLEAGLDDLCDDNRSLNTKQPYAIPNKEVYVWDLVIHDMDDRDKMGEIKHKTRLQPHNGRDSLIDAYQEALDLIVYLRQAIYERDGK